VTGPTAPTGRSPSAGWPVDRPPLPVSSPEAVADYRAEGWWSDETVGGRLRQWAAERGGRPAIFVGDRTVTWGAYDALADHLAWALAGAGLEPGARVGILLGDGAAVHAAFVGAGRAGLTAVGIGARTGVRDVAHLLRTAGARTLVVGPMHRGQPAPALAAELAGRRVDLAHLVVVDELADPPVVTVDSRSVRAPSATAAEALEGERALGPLDVGLVNSTSGTTGLPKLVRQFEARWWAFHRLAAEAGALGDDEVVASLIPAPYGFGLWTSHVTPAILGVPVAVLPRFEPAAAWALLERHRVRVLCAVVTQLALLLADPAAGSADTSALRLVFTGGEAVSERRAGSIEARAGATVLQFYGSNETGAFSRTTLDDPAEVRLGTLGRLIDVQRPRLYDGDREVTAQGGPGRPACRGPVVCAGYEGDEAANRRLCTAEGWMLMDDLVTVDADGVVHLVGRDGDFIVRGGKNVSALAVEDAVCSHPAVALAAAVGVPDDRFGERVGVFVVLREGRRLALDELVAHLAAEGYSPESFPERLLVVDELPAAPGGKVAKHLLRAELVAGAGSGRP
jgi:acyl-CoA synthetase